MEARADRQQEVGTSVSQPEATEFGYNQMQPEADSSTELLTGMETG